MNRLPPFCGGILSTQTDDAADWLLFLFTHLFIYSWFLSFCYPNVKNNVFTFMKSLFHQSIPPVYCLSITPIRKYLRSHSWRTSVNKLCFRLNKGLVMPRSYSDVLVKLNCTRQDFALRVVLVSAKKNSKLESQKELPRCAFTSSLHKHLQRIHNIYVHTNFWNIRQFTKC